MADGGACVCHLAEMAGFSAIAGRSYDWEEIKSATSTRLPSDYELMAESVAKLVMDFRSYGLAALTGEGDFYRQMAETRSKAAREFAAEIADKAAREKGEQAWAKQDFEGVVKAYRSMEERLSRAERARLPYATQRIKK